jgi:hypothetical protein
MGGGEMRGGQEVWRVEDFSGTRRLSIHSRCWCSRPATTSAPSSRSNHSQNPRCSSCIETDQGAKRGARGKCNWCCQKRKRHHVWPNPPSLFWPHINHQSLLTSPESKCKVGSSHKNMNYPWSWSCHIAASLDNKPIIEQKNGESHWQSSHKKLNEQQCKGMKTAVKEARKTSLGGGATSPQLKYQCSANKRKKQSHNISFKSRTALSPKKPWKQQLHSPDLDYSNSS